MPGPPMSGPAGQSALRSVVDFDRHLVGGGAASQGSKGGLGFGGDVEDPVARFVDVDRFLDLGEFVVGVWSSADALAGDGFQGLVSDLGDVVR